MHIATNFNGVQNMQVIEVGSSAGARTLIVEEKPASTLYVSDATRSQPDSCWAAIAESGQESRCSLWWRNTPQLGNQRVGIIGHYAAGDDETAQALLAHACNELRAHSCSLAVGPMNANTWSDYRFVTEFGSEPQFWLEPANPPEWPQQFVRNNFQPLAQYFSALNERLDHQERGLDQVAQPLRTAGVRLRPVSEQTFDDDVRRIFSVARVAFRSNMLFSEPDEHEFICQSRPLRRFAALELSWVAEHHGQTVGFLFAVPDMLEEARLGRSQSVIIKTLATIPERAYAGLGQLMLAHVQRHSLKQGYTRAIHALMRDVGSMRRLSGRYARPIRRYTLFAKALTS
jgi:GNAT superfamily N-acetyltransferase